jgi:hypothetical protein
MMKGFDGLWNAAVDRIQGERLVDQLRALDFPAALAVLGVGQAPPREPPPELLDQVAAQVGGADGERLHHALQQLFVARKPPGEAGSQDVLIRALQVGGGFARPGLPVTPEEAARILDGQLDRPPSPLTNTLRWLYGNAAATAVAETVRRIIARDNETARLAILIYARAHGIPLTPEGLDALHDGPLNSQDPDLGPALAAGVQVLTAQRGGEPGVVGVLRRLRL